MSCDADHVLASTLHGLLDGDRHFTRLAVTESDSTFAVTDHCQCGEAHLTTTLDGLRHTIHGDQLLEQAVAGLTIIAGHVSPVCRSLGIRTSICGLEPLGVVVDGTESVKRSEWL